MQEETHDAWVRVWTAVTARPADSTRAACPNCGHFNIRFRFVADSASRVGLCALWCTNCGRGHTLSRVRVPEHIDFIPLDASDEVIRQEIPDFVDAIADMPKGGSAAGVGSVSVTGGPPGHAVEQQLLATARAASDRLPELLTPRERQVFALLNSGLPVQAIAAELALSPATVRTYLQRMHWKLSDASITGLLGSS